MQAINFWHRYSRKYLEKGIKIALGEAASLDNLPALSRQEAARLLRICDSCYPFPRRDGVAMSAWLKERSLLMVQIQIQLQMDGKSGQRVGRSAK